ncbi:cytochrome P450 [Aspergillus neoniger CBS 115656]|uniref:Cytochrome P450 n=1 Tax=Aspergillus neoniger (strain CBS 115656) TaxID=1448310 RepID=A0A318YIQ6_ASPNB|nr:cytochrome P450 [Aspergillus neoniger CBS 115656]PYH32390.1 cytochrome P450 [Aspergillus neoniger CBS 115656]
MDYYRAILVIFVFLSLRTIYRLVLHPLRGIPGPKLAAATSLYEFYYDVVKGGNNIWGAFIKLTRSKGPIVRVSPGELHIKDPYFYNEIYASSSNGKRDKDATLVRSFCCPSAMFSTVSHDLHRSRRAVISHLFTRRAVVSLESIIQDKISKLSSRLESIQRGGSIVSLKAAFGALISDILGQYLYAEDLHYLDDPKFKSDSIASANELAAKIHIFRYLPFLVTLFTSVPLTLLRSVHSVSDLVDFKLWLRKQAQDAIQHKERSTKASGPVFAALLSSNGPTEEKSLVRLEDESLVLYSGGGDSTSQTLSVALFHLLKNKQLVQTLRKELKQVMPTPTHQAKWSELERLPYLNVNLKSFLVALSKGSRQCIGINLAYAVLYLTVATLIRRYDMELYDTTEDELRTARDFLLSRPEKGHAIVNVMVRDILTT